MEAGTASSPGLSCRHDKPLARPSTARWPTVPPLGRASTGTAHGRCSSGAKKTMRRGGGPGAAGDGEDEEHDERRHGEEVEGEETAAVPICADEAGEGGREEQPARRRTRRPTR